jgi:hypothetical protein
MGGAWQRGELEEKKHERYATAPVHCPMFCERHCICELHYMRAATKLDSSHPRVLIPVNVSCATSYETLPAVQRVWILGYVED